MDLLLSLVGPPAVGKSTVSRALAVRHDAQVFRLREFAHELQRRDPGSARLFDNVDALGWFGAGAVAYCLRRAFVEREVAAAGMVVLENFPGSRVQFGQLHAVAAARAVPLVLVELVAPEDVLWQRVAARRVCPTCEPDPHGDPHRPARGLSERPGRCATCSGELTTRRGDRPATFAARLARFSERIGAIRRAAIARGRPLYMVHATVGVDACLDEMRAVCQTRVDRRGCNEPEEVYE